MPRASGNKARMAANVVMATGSQRLQAAPAIARTAKSERRERECRYAQVAKFILTL